jgi:hypothetical protein
VARDDDAQPNKVYANDVGHLLHQGLGTDTRQYVGLLAESHDHTLGICRFLLQQIP